jgi:chemotaxis protein MotB
MAAIKPTIVVKKVKKGHGGHHGGAWKIAYADFVTAMMAFFLLMWLLSSTSKAKLEGIAEYFKTPMKVAMQGGSSVSERTSVIKGGGKDVTKKDGEVRKVVDLDTAQKELERREKAQLEALKKKIEEAIEANPLLRQFRKQLLLDITSEGLRIQIVDEQNRPMFGLASAALQPYTRDILREIGRMLNDVPNRVALSGHTDNMVYAGGERGYSNWELSSERANASRRELVHGGMQEAKVLRVVGLSSAVPLDKDNPGNPINRRISIVVMNKRAEQAVTGEGEALNAVTGAEVGRALGGGPAAAEKTP